MAALLETIASVEQRKWSFSRACTILNISKCLLIQTREFFGSLKPFNPWRLIKFGGLINHSARRIDFFLNIHKKIPKILLSIPKRRGRWISDRLYRKQKYCQSSRFPLNLWHDIIRNLERIMTVDQIDVFFVLLLWPNNPMGQIMNFQHPDVENMIKY